VEGEEVAGPALSALPGWVWIAGSAALAADLAVTFAVLRDAGLTDGQRRMQLGLVWLLPVLGAAFVFAVRREVGIERPASDTEWKNPDTGPDDFPHE
jgi:hypothetical protein